MYHTAVLVGSRSLPVLALKKHRSLFVAAAGGTIVVVEVNRDMVMKPRGATYLVEIGFRPEEQTLLYPKCDVMDIHAD